MPAKAVAPASNPANSSSVLVLAVDEVTVKPSAYFGFSARESTGSAVATFELYDGTDDTGVLLESVELAQGTSDRAWYGDQTVEVASGNVYLRVVAGSVKIAVFLA